MFTIRQFSWVALLSTLVLGGACGGTLGEDGGEDLSLSTGMLRATNGVALNGVALNGVALNGVALNGVALNGVALNGVALNGVGFSGSAILSGSQLTGTLNGSKISGTQIQGAILKGNLPGGKTIRLKITTAEQVDADRWKYFVQYETTTGWKYLCVSSDGEHHSATAFAGTWDTTGAHRTDSTQFTFGCNAGLGALGKCVDFGYRPWKTYNGTSLANYHQACTRMVRADYCGDGHAWTKNGSPIDMWDKLGIQKDTAEKSGERQRFDAQWGPNGAICMDTNEERDGSDPTCESTLAHSDCSKVDRAGTLIWNESIKSD